MVVRNSTGREAETGPTEHGLYLVRQASPIGGRLFSMSAGEHIHIAIPSIKLLPVAAMVVELVSTGTL